jgi:hypothetical protein
MVGELNVRMGLDLARSKTWTNDCPRHTSDSTTDEAIDWNFCCG